MSSDRGYKRINFFKGFLTTEKDWNDAESFHMEKRRLHNRRLHAPGVVLGYAGELKVLARSRGELSVEVQSGYAIDGVGNDLLLWDAQIKNINLEEYRLPQTVYVVLRYAEELTDFIAYKENLEYKGHRRVLERAVVEISQTEPDIHREVELARIFLEKGVVRVRDARDPSQPKANEIDMRYVAHAGVAGSFLHPATRRRLESVLWQIRGAFLDYAHRQVLSARDVVQSANTALMLNSGNSVDLRNVFELFFFIVEGEHEVCLDVAANHPNIYQKEDFSLFRRQVEILRGVLAERKNDDDALTNLLQFQNNACEAAQKALEGEEAVIQAPEKAEEEEAKPIDINDWEGVKVLPNPPDSIELEGTTWLLVDQIAILDKESEEKHEFVIEEAKDSYRSRQKLKYPDGTVVEDTGRAHVGGYAGYKISNLTPGRPAVILRRMDYVYGDYEIEYFIDGASVGTVSCAGTDRAHRWRNWPFMIEAEHVTGSGHTIKQTPLTAGRDVNMFHIWVYQPA